MMKMPMLENLNQRGRETILALARAARLQRQGTTQQERIPVRPSSGREWPLSFAQQRLWFIAQMGEDASAAYHIPGGLRLRGQLDERALRAALDRIVQRHEVLRTVFVTVDGQPVQRIAERGQFALERDDLSALTDDAAQDAELARWTQLEGQTAFDLSTGPLIRGRLLPLAEHDHVLLVTMHHIVSDGWSAGILAKELGALYQAYARDGIDPSVDPLPSLPVQYADYALWQRQWLTGDVQQRQLAYWTEELSGAPGLVTLPTDRPRPAVQSYAGDRIAVELDAALTAGLKALSQRHGTTMYMTLLAAWAALAARLASQDEVVIGSPVANRTRTEVEPLIGFFVNTLALRVDLSARPTVAELLAQVKHRSVQAQSHQDVPFEHVVEALRPERSLAHSPIFQLSFAWQSAPQATLQLGELALESVEGAYHSAQFELMLSLAEADGRIVGNLGFATALYDRSTMVRHLGYLRALLHGMVQDDRVAVDQIPILSEAERRQVLVDWNATQRAYPQAECIHEWFERQAARTPDAVAIEFEAQRLSYRELNARANRLAYHLRTLGVGPDQRVAICVQRGPELVEGTLAVLKAGGAYVPLDPAYPTERLAYMLRDSAPVVLLTQTEWRDRLAPADATPELAVLALDGAERPWDQLPAHDLPAAQVGVTPRNLAYVIYTSGSTGQPKGVMVEHRGVVNRLLWMQEAYGLTAEDGVMQRRRSASTCRSGSYSGR